MQDSRSSGCRRTWCRVLAVVLLTLAGFRVVDAAPRVVVTIKPVHSLLSALMAGVAEPVLLLQDDAAPWRYRADPDTLHLMEQADLVVWAGPELEQALGPQLAAIRPQGRVIELLASNALKILPARDDHRARDPWFWLDTRNMLILLDEMTRVLMGLDPARSHVYRRNRLQMLPRLSRLDSEMEYAYRDVSGTPVLLYHDTQQYFEQAYALKVAAYATTTVAESPAASNMLRLRSLIGQHRLSCLFVEADMPAPHLDLLAVHAPMRIVELTSLGQGLEPGPDLYERLIRHNYDRFRECAAGNKPDPSQADEAVELPPHRIQTRYLLEDHNGVPVTNLDFPDQYQLIYFGYTYCPDICPTSLAVLSRALELLGEKADSIQPLFISVDPARDTAEVLRKYTTYFHPRLLGLIGSEEMVQRVTAGFRVQYEKVPSDTDPTRYSMDHTSSLFLLDPHGNFRAKFAHGIPPVELVRRLDEIIPDP